MQYYHILIIPLDLLSKLVSEKPLKNKISPNGYEFDHLTTRSIKENAQTDINMYKKPN